MEEENKKWLQNIETNDLSIKDKNTLFIYKKTERIAIATYLVTNIFNEQEPVKWDLRQKSIELLSFNIHLGDNFISERERVFFLIEESLSSILSSFSVAYISGLLSEMNYMILKKEIELVINLVQRTKSYILTNDFFNFSDTVQPDDKKTENFTTKDKNDKGHYLYKETKYESEHALERRKIENKDEDPYSPSFIKKNNRKNNIVDIIKMKKTVTIKDISLIIKDCSEKTIQRELVSLVKEGVLKREGERRWSTYSLT